MIAHSRCTILSSRCNETFIVGHVVDEDEVDNCRDDDRVDKV